MLGPSLRITWFFCCGALASGRLVAPAITGLGLLAAWFAADALLGYVFRSLVTLKEARAPTQGQPRGVSASRLGAAGRMRQPTENAAAMAALTGCGILLVLTTYIGRQPLLVAAAALFCGALVTLLAADDGALQWRVMSGVQVAAAWLLGHSALAPLNGGTLGLALLMGLAAYARLLAGSRPLAARRILTWAWIILVVASIQGRQPVVTAAVAVGGIAERLQGGQRAARSGGRWLSQFQQWAPWLAATALTALAATHWG